MLAEPTRICAMAQKIRPEGAPIKPLAQYQRPIRAACSSRFHQDEVIKTKPGLRQDSNIPRKKRAAASELKVLAEPVAARVAPISQLDHRALNREGDIPQRTKLMVRYFPIGYRCMRRLVGYWATR
jgi:hypothetical protein